MMSPLQKIRTSFATQLTLWVAGFVVAIVGIVIILLTGFSQETIYDESIDTTLQALENTVVRIDNTLRQAEMTARLEHHRLRVNRSRVVRLVEEDGSLATMKQLLPNVQLFVTRNDSSRFDAFITGNKRSYRKIEYEGREMIIFSQPIGSRPFSLTAMCPAEDVYGRFSRMNRIIIASSIFGVLLLIFILYFVIAHHLRPLHLLANAAQSIAGGDLKTQIPDTQQQHETGRLQTSLKRMQRSLRTYMEEMQQKRATLSAQNEELQTAYQEAQAYEDKKVKFLHDLTDRMAAPVDAICHSTDIICHDYQRLSRAEMEELQTEVSQKSETITQLLDQLIKEPAGL